MPVIDRMDDAGKAVGFFRRQPPFGGLKPHQLRLASAGLPATLRPRDTRPLYPALCLIRQRNLHLRRADLSAGGFRAVPDPAGEMVGYEADEEDPWGYAWIGFEGRAAEPLLEKAGFMGETRTAVLPETRACFQRIRQSDPDRPFSALRLCRYLYTVFTVLEEQKHRPVFGGAYPALYAHRAAEYMQANYDRPITVEGWPVCSASTGGISPACLPGRPA